MAAHARDGTAATHHCTRLFAVASRKGRSASPAARLARAMRPASTPASAAAASAARWQSRNSSSLSSGSSESSMPCSAAVEPLTSKNDARAP